MDDGEATYKVFAPLRGWYSLALTKLDEALVFAPLRDGTRMNRNNEAHFKFSSPYGDSTCTRT